MTTHAQAARIFDLTGRVAVITGGAGLLGRRHAGIIAAAGGIPVIADLPAADPAGTAAQLGAAYGVPALGWPTDITDPEQVRGLLAAILERFGSVDILINNAGILRDKMSFNMSEEDFDVVVDVVLKPEILDPQGQAILGALGRLGIVMRIVHVGKTLPPWA